MGRQPSLSSVAQGIIETSKGTLDLCNDWERWLSWLKNAESFRYVPKSSEPAYTVRKEKSTKGDAFYWYAYRKSSGKLAKCYVGLDHDLTVDNLEAIAQKLTSKLQRKVTEKVTDNISVTNEVVTDILSVTNQSAKQLQIQIEELQRQLSVTLGKSKN
jgi:IS1 family transposase